MNILPLGKTSKIVVQEIKGELMIYDLTTDKVIYLNQTAAIVYRACDGKTTFAELKRKHKFTDDLIYFALDELKQQNLLGDGEYYVSPLAGMSRREAVKKVGLATIIALPFITSALAPTASQAQSVTCRANGDTCAQGSECCSGACQPFGVCVTCIGVGGFPLAGGCSAGNNAQQCCSKACDPANPSNCL